MSLVYQIMYRLGATPWEHRDPPAPLTDLIVGPRALPPGDMLDIGCGTGHYAIYCARHGWNVTGVDAVGRALAIARRNAEDADVKIRFLQADITSPATTGLGGGYSLLLDVGCLHGLADGPLQRAADTITGAAKPGATLLILAFAPGWRGPAPRGIDPARIPALFPQWDLAFSRPADQITVNGPVRSARASWYQLIKQ
jgi:SAM-dependent methyltransferase